MQLNIDCSMLSEGCCGEQYPSRLEEEGKISQGFFRRNNKWHGVAPNDDELKKALTEIERSQ